MADYKAIIENLLAQLEDPHRSIADASKRIDYLTPAEIATAARLLKSQETPKKKYIRIMGRKPNL